jgi:hypothetical protein
MRKFILVVALGLSLFFFLSVYATPPASPVWTVRLHASHGFKVGDVVEEAGHRIGQVVGVESYTDRTGETGASILITLDPGSRERLRERATFLVVKPGGSTRPVLTLVVFDEHSPPLPPGSQIAGVESEFELELKRQLAAAEDTVRVFTRQLDDLRQTLDRASHSEERKKLEDSVGGLFDTLRRTRNDIARVIIEEMGRWKKLYDKLFPSERAEPVRVVS